MGASLAYYTVLAIAPLLLVLIGVAGLVFRREDASAALMAQIGSLVGQQGADAINTILQNAGQKKSSGAMAAIVGFATLLFGASSLALELRSDLDKIWHVKTAEGVAGFLKERSYALAIVLGAGFLLLVSLAISAALATMGKFFGGLLPAPAWALEALNALLSLLAIAAILGCIFKLLPAVRIAWRDVVPGAVFTAILFTLGKSLIGIYLGKAAVASTYGAAGSLVVLLIWIYYSAQILFFGAEFTRIYAQEYGSQPRPEPAQSKAPVPPPASQPEQVERTNTSLPASVAGLVGTLTGFALFSVKLFRDGTPKQKADN